MANDLALRQEILDELEFEPSVDAAQIGVAVKDGVVTLSGRVDTYAEKLAAEKAAKRVRGVKAVAEDIEVRVPSGLMRSDTEIAAAAVGALEWSTVIPHDRVRVKVENGWVTLEGELPWAYQRDSADRAVRFLSGVRGVTNLVTVKPQVATREIKDRILSAFRRSAELDAGTVRVDAIGGKVTLAGNVHSWNERTEAERVAWAAAGVAQVENRITVSAL
jgi:osmotically-inducible protein OsmY